METIRKHLKALEQVVAGWTEKDADYLRQTSEVDRTGYNIPTWGKGENGEYGCFPKNKENYMQYVLFADRVCVNETELLIVSVFGLAPKPALKYRIYFNRTSFISYKLKERKYSNAMLETLNGYWNEDYFLYSAHTFDVIHKYLNRYAKTAYGMIDSFQKNIRKNELERKYDKIRERIDMDLVDIPEPPSDLDDFIDNVVLRKNRYFTYARNGKKIIGECSYCHESNALKKARHNEYIVCPHCGSRLQLKSLGKCCTTETISKTFQVAQKLHGRLIVRGYQVHAYYTQSYRERSIGSEEKQRDIILLNSDDRYNKQKSYYFDFFRGTSERRWCDSCGGGGYPDFSGSYIYTKNLREVLADTEYKYCAIGLYGQAGKRTDVTKYLENYLKHREIEYLVKMKLYNLAEHIVSSGTSRDILQDGKFVLKKETIPVLQEIDVRYMEMNLFAAGERNNRQVTAEDILWLRNSTIAQWRYHEICKILTFTSFGKFREYFTELLEQDKQRREKNRGCHCGYMSAVRDSSSDDLVGDYEDYLENASKAGFDMRSKDVLFPKDFRTKHDLAAELVKQLIEQKEKEGIVGRFAEWNESLKFSAGGFEMRMIKDAKELTAEGEALHHCVATYAAKYARGECLILCVRKTETPEVPYYTVEWDPDENRIVQYRGFANNVEIPVDPNVTKFLSKWKKEVNKRQKQARIEAAVRNMGVAV